MFGNAVAGNRRVAPPIAHRIDSAERPKLMGDGLALRAVARDGAKIVVQAALKIDQHLPLRRAQARHSRRSRSSAATMILSRVACPFAVSEIE